MISTPPENLEVVTNGSGPLGDPPFDCWNRIGVQGDKSCPELLRVVHCRNCPVFSAAGAQLFASAPPSDWLDERADRVSEPIGQEGGSTVAILAMRLGEEWLALDVRSVIEVAEPRIVHSVPHRTGRLIEGLVNIRGELQLCVSLARLLKIERDRTDESKCKARFVVAEHRGGRWVFPVDEVAGVQQLRADQLLAPPATVERCSNHFSRGVWQEGSTVLGFLDTDRLFAELERSIR